MFVYKLLIVFWIGHEVVVVTVFIFRRIKIISNFHIAVFAVLNNVVDGQEQVANVLLIVDVQWSESDETEIFNEVSNSF